MKQTFVCVNNFLCMGELPSWEASLLSVRVMKLDPTLTSYADYQHELFNSDAQFCL